MKAFILITVEALPVMEQEIQFQPSGVLTIGKNRKKKKNKSVSDHILKSVDIKTTVQCLNSNGIKLTL